MRDYYPEEVQFPEEIDLINGGWEQYGSNTYGRVSTDSIPVDDGMGTREIPMGELRGVGLGQQEMIPPGPPPPLDVTGGPKNLREDMPQLYKKPSADQNIPPGPQPNLARGEQDQGAYQQTERARFIETLKKNLGFDPIAFDPVGQAFTETKKEFLEKYGPDYLLSEGTKKVFDEKMKERMMEYVPKKVQGEGAIKFALEQFDKEMGWKNVNAGGALVQPGTGARIENPVNRRSSLIEIRERAAQGDPEAQTILDQMQKEKADAVKAGVDARGVVTEKDTVKPLLNKLPKMMETAQASQKRVLMYENLSEMAEKGSGGLVPGLKGILAPLGEALGMDTEKMSEAQAYQLMARAGVGKMRLELVEIGRAHV